MSRHKRSLIEQMIFGSDRPGHLFAAAVVNGMTFFGWNAIADLMGRGLTFSLSILPSWGDRLLLSVVDQMVPIHVGVGIFLWELIATMDCDVMERRSVSGILKAFWVIPWLPYGWAIKHRSPLSHSLLIGTPLRMLYLSGLIFLIQMRFWGLGLMEYFEILLPILPSIAACALAADTTHLWKDGYPFRKMLLGR